VGLVLKQLRSRLGELSPTIETQITKLPVGALDELAIALLHMNTVEASEQWLQEQV
jgi:hypothetical protein